MTMIKATYRTAMAAGQDAGDRSAKLAGRSVWVAEDWDEAATVVALLLGAGSSDRPPSART